MKRVAAGGIPALLVALGLHGLALGALLALPSPARHGQARRPALRVRVVPRPVRRPVPRQEVPQTIDRPRPRPAPRPRPEPRRPAPPRPEPEAPAPPADEAPAPRRFTISMEATVATGGVAVPAGDRPAPRASAPTGQPGGEGVASAPVPVSELTVLPRLLQQPSPTELRAAYPEAARREAIEGDVRLRLLVSATGRVTQVRLVRSAGQGFDAVALRLVKAFRFRPGQRGGQPVPVWIPWTYKFRLAD